MAGGDQFAQEVSLYLRSKVPFGLILFLMASTVGAALALGEDSSIQPLPPVAAVEQTASYSFLDAEAEEEDLTLEERVAKLEAGYSGLGDDYKKLDEDSQDLKDGLKILATSGHSEATMVVNGRIHADMWSFPHSSPGVNVFETGDPLLSPQDAFGFRRLRFGVKGDIWKTMLYKIEMEFAGGNDAEFRDATLGWEELPVLQTLLIGNQKRPYGLDHLNSSRYNVFLERPFVIESFNQDARRLGIVSYGVSEDQAWNWRYGIYNQRLVQDEGFYRSDHWQLELAGRMANTFWYDETSGGRGYGHWAVSGTYAEPDGSAGGNRSDNEAQFRHRPEARSANRWLNTGDIAGADNYQLLGLENLWNFGPLQLVGEYQNIWLERDPGFGGDLRFDGAYMYASYFLTGEHMPWKRSLGILDRIKPFENFFLVDTCNDGVRGGWGAWQVAYRLSYADFNDDNIFGGRGLSHTLGINWYWNAYARLQFNAIYGEIDDAAISDGDNNNDVPAFIPPGSGHYTILGMRAMVDF